MCDNDENDEEKKGVEDMATLEMPNQYTVNEREMKLIANTPTTNVKKPSYASEFHLSPEERQKRAVNALNKWK